MKNSNRSFYQFISQLSSSDTYLSLGIVGLLVLMIVPISPLMLDFLLATSIAASFGILLMAIYHKSSRDLSIFPTLLLLVTLYRLALNVASTRLILSNAKLGNQAAGQLIAKFGEIVIHGNTFVGILVFVILNVINFIVITKGSGRISEVSARFMLDSLPGKQMSIEADLKAGAIDVQEAQQKRAEIDQQTDFYGAMDGASKFVKGDAIAGLVITGINLLGGLFVGIAQEGLPFAKAIKTYSLLSIGDGLAAQFPALIVSTAAGIVVTKASSSRNAIGHDFATQLSANPRLFFVLSVILAGIGIVMGGAANAFFALSFICAFIGFWTRKINNSLKNQNDSDDEFLSQGISFEKKNELKVATNEVAFRIQVGLGLAHLLFQDKHFQSDLNRFVNELSEKNKTKMPVIELNDSQDLDLFEYSFQLDASSFSHKLTLSERGFYVLGSDELSELDQRFVKDDLLSRPCAWVNQEERDLFVQRGFVVVSSAELFRWHLFLAYKKSFQHSEAKHESPKSVELNVVDETQKEMGI